MNNADKIEAEIAAVNREIKALQTEGASHYRNGKTMSAKEIQSQIAYLAGVLEKLMDKLDAVAG